MNGDLALLLTEFVAGRSFSDYETDAMLHSAVERQPSPMGRSLYKRMGFTVVARWRQSGGGGA